MKLNPDFVTQTIDGTQFMVPIGDTAFRGLVRSNKTAAFIIECLKQDTTQDAIVDAMCRKYDAPRETIAADVEGVLNKLRQIGALDE